MFLMSGVTSFPCGLSAATTSENALMTTSPLTPLGPEMTIAETVRMLKNPQLAIGWALEHVPHQLIEFFTQWKAHDDEYQWSINMTEWAEYARTT